MRVVLYTRVSTEEQVKEGFSLAAQLDRLRSFCDSQGWDIVDFYTDEGVSAKNTERPQLKRLLRDCTRQKFDIVVVYRLDRLTRSVMNLYELLQIFDTHKIGFKSATEVFDTTNAMGRLFITIVAALAQWERENLGERIRMGFDQKKREGKWHSTNAPFGYRRVGDQLVVVEEEAEVIRELFDRYIAGYGVHRLLTWLRANTDLLWTNSRTYYALNNPIYAGFLVIGDRNAEHAYETVDATNVTPIITRDTWAQARAIARTRSGLPPRSGTGQYALVGVLKCGLCGGAVVGYTTRKPTGYHYYGYKCLKAMRQHDCGAKMHKMGGLEDRVLTEIERVAQEAFDHASRPLPKKDDRQKRKLEQIVARTKERKNRWMDAYEAGTIDADTLRERLEQISGEEESARSELATMDAPTIDMQTYQGIVAGFRTSWSSAETQERKELIRAIVEAVFVYNDGSVRVDLRR
ncbi:MAG: recombinase family protein [Bacilli bacterium]